MPIFLDPNDPGYGIFSEHTHWPPESGPDEEEPPKMEETTEAITPSAAPAVLAVASEEKVATTKKLVELQPKLVEQISKFSREEWTRYVPSNKEYEIYGNAFIQVTKSGLGVSLPSNRRGAATAWVPFEKVMSDAGGQKPQLNIQQLIDIANKLAEIAEVAGLTLMEERAKAALKKIDDTRSRLSIG